jgi:pyruvate dehydrogenase complex dehydrogenase (E1) component
MPSVIVARTVKGYPLDAAVLGKDPNHHGKPLTEEEAKKAVAEIDRMPA